MSNTSPILTSSNPLGQSGPIDHAKLASDICRIYDRKAEEIYVIMDGKHTTVVKDHGLGRPWCNINPRVAEVYAKQITEETGAPTHVVSLADAIKLLCGQLCERN